MSESGPSTLDEMEAVTPAPERRVSAKLVWLALAAIVLTSTLTTVMAMRRTSPTFDEITTMAGGARGFRAGSFDLMPDFPPLMQFLYGLPGYFSSPSYPVEPTDTLPNRYLYAQQFLYDVGNDPEQVAFRARLVAAACAALLIILTFAFAKAHWGVGVGLLSAALVAFLPDVLAHGGIAYNDIALAPAFLAGMWGIDAALRRPTLWRAAIAGVLVSLAVGIKHSALILGPVAIALILFEAIARHQRKELRSWLPTLGVVLGVAIAVGYLVQVLLYTGDFSLAYLRASTLAAQGHILGGHGVPAYLLGRFSAHAPWYYYPVAFLYKTPASMHVLMVIAGVAALTAVQTANWRNAFASKLRAPAIALVLFGAVLLRANLVIGFRYALPLLPIVCVLTAIGAMYVWRNASKLVRALIVILPCVSAASSLAYYPHFIAYTSEYNPEPELGYSVFVDSSLDWGQGLLELRDFMRKENVSSIYLSYFGSGVPDAYGIKYVPLPSFFALRTPTAPVEPPRYVAISATNLVGLYFTQDIFAQFRNLEPYRVLGHSLFIFEAPQ